MYDNLILLQSYRVVMVLIYHDLSSIFPIGGLILFFFFFFFDVATIVSLKP